MKIYILLLAFIFTALTVSAQKINCSESQPRPITGNQHPCPGSIETYCIENDRNYSAFVWDVPRAHAGEPPVGWEIISGQGTNCVTVRVGQKNGTMKVTVIDPECGTKVATLPVKPGESLEVTVKGPQAVCIGEKQIYTASVNQKQKGAKQSSFTFTWTYPADWTVVKDSNPNDGSITLVPGATSGTVTAYVEDVSNKQGNGNNGAGVGGIKAYCGSASDGIDVTSQACSGRKEEPVCVIKTEEFNFGYMGSIVNQQNTTVRFSVENLTADPIETFIIEVPEGIDNIQPIEPAGFSANIEDNLITYERTNTESASGNETIIFSFMIPTTSGELATYYTLTALSGSGFGSTGFNTTTCDDQPINPLPVELSSFNGKATASGIELTWTTASEKDNDYFEIQRSKDGNKFTTVGKVKGAGNSSAALTYTFTDATAPKGLNYYRLKQVDFDGSSDVSKVVALESNITTQKSAGMSLYPNPATGSHVNIVLSESNLSSSAVIVTITDMNGRKVFEQQIAATTNNEINLALDQMRITKGLYMVKVQGENITETQKLIVR